MVAHYPTFAEEIKATETVDSFHLAEENKKEFPHHDVRYNYNT